MALTPWEAIGISLAGLLGGWLAYHWLCKSPLGRHTGLLAISVFLLILAAAWGFSHVFSGRGAFIHIGAFVGTMMAANVFMVIIPNQKKITAALLRGEKPDPIYGVIGKQRSLHNTYLTLPVLFMMVSNHYPMVTNHPQAWILAGLFLSPVVQMSYAVGTMGRSPSRRSVVSFTSCHKPSADWAPTEAAVAACC